MDGRVLGSKQVVVRLHEPKQLRQEKLAKRFANSSSSSTSSPGASHPGSPSPPSSQYGLYPNAGYGYGQQGYGGYGHGGRSRSGATSPTASESGFSVVNWQGQSPRAGYQALGLNISGDRPRRGSGSYYNVNHSSKLPFDIPNCFFYSFFLFFWD